MISNNKSSARGRPRFRSILGTCGSRGEIMDASWTGPATALALVTRSCRPPSHRTPSVHGLLAPDQFTLLGHGALHQEHEEHEPQAQDGEQPEDVEVGQGRRLLLAEIAKRLENH